MVNPIRYLQEVQQEVQKVSWPSRQQTISMTMTVIVVSLFLAGFLAGTDFVFNQMVTLLIKQ